MFSPDHRSFSPDNTPRQPRLEDTRARLSAHKGWKQRVGAALLSAAGMLGAEGCATTSTSPSDEAYSNIQYGAAATRQRSEQTRITERENYQTSYEDCERQAETVMRDIRSHRYNDRSAVLHELSRSIRGIDRAFRQDPLLDNQTLLTPRDVDGTTATILRQALRFVRDERRTALREARIDYTEPPSDSTTYADAERIAVHIHSLGSLGSLANSRAREYVNGGYATPVDDMRRLFNNQLTEQEIINVDLYATADFVRAYAHALQRQEDRAVARSYERPRNAMRGRYNDDLPSGIAFENQRPAPPSTPPTLRLTENPYGDDTDQPSHRRHHRHHRP